MIRRRSHSALATMITKSYLAFVVVSGLVAVPTMVPYSTGVESGNLGVPADCSKVLPACSACHIGAAPSLTAPDPDTPQTSVTTAGDVRALALGASLSVTTSIAGGTPGTEGGFVCEATAGSFTAGASTQILTNTASVTHANDLNRSWTYTFDAPASPGLVELTSAANAVNGDAMTTGDHFSFAGYDRNAQSATPVGSAYSRSGVANLGAACPDGYGNFAVLGANNTPTVGDAGFELRLHGARPNTTAYLWGGFNTNPAHAQSLDSIGLMGCTSYIQTIDASQVQVTTAGATERAEGDAVFPLPLVGAGALIGASFEVQAGYFDPSVITPSVGGAMRSLPLTLTNGLRVTLQ